MKQITHLIAEAVDAPWHEPRGILTAICDEPVPGFLRTVSLGEAGLIIKHGDAQVGIPLADIIRAAAAADPRLLPPPPTPTDNA